MFGLFLEFDSVMSLMGSQPLETEAMFTKTLHTNIYSSFFSYSHQTFHVSFIKNENLIVYVYV